MRLMSNFYIRVGSVLLFLMASGIPGNLSALEVTAVRVLESAQVEEEKVCLGQISEISGKDQPLVQDLKHLFITNAPHPGRSRYLDEDFIKLRLRQHNIDLSRIKLIVPDGVKIFRSTAQIPLQRIEKVISGFIKRKLRWAGDRAQLKEINIMDRVVLPRGECSIQVIAPGNTDYLGTTYLSLLFTVNGKYQKRARASVKVEVITEVVIAGRPLKRHHLINEDDVSVKKMDLGGLPSGAVFDLREVVGKRVKRNINIDEVITGEAIELVPWSIVETSCG